MPQTIKYPTIRSEGEPYTPPRYPTIRSEGNTPPAPPSGIPNIDVTGSYGGVLPTQVPADSAPLPTFGQGPPNVDVTGQYKGALPTREMPNNVAWNPTFTPQTYQYPQISEDQGTPYTPPTQTGNVAATQPPPSNATTAQPGASQPSQPGASQPAPATPATPAAPVTVKHKVQHADGSTSEISHKSAAAQPQPQQGQGRGQQGQQPEVRRAYPVGVTPRALPVQGQGWAQGQPQQGGQNVNLQVPAHPGLLQRIGQTIGHFFSGTLGQWAPQQGQQPQAQPAQPVAGSNALSGVHRALQSGRQHVMRHGPSAPASQAAPAAPFPYQPTSELNTWETGTEMPGAPSRIGIPSEQTTNAFPYVANPDLLRAGGTLPPKSQFTLSSGY
jgi:hypothetical protein